MTSHNRTHFPNAKNAQPLQNDQGQKHAYIIRPLMNHLLVRLENNMAFGWKWLPPKLLRRFGIKSLVLKATYAEML
jgi:hypothetical protein